MSGFTVVWIGQLVSMAGSGMTQFALMIWAWQITGHATALALVGFFGFLPRILLSPIAGALVDRWNRKLVMMLSDLAAGLATVALFVLYQMSALEMWHIYAAAAFSGAFGSFQFPAYSASISLMVEKKQLTRANAMLGVAESAATIFAPMAAGALLVFIGIGGVMVIDIVTFLFAIGVLLLVRIPQPAKHHVEETKGRSLLADSVFGFRYIFARPSLSGLLFLFLALNLVLTFCGGVLAPMILARSGDSELILGTVQMLFGVGGLAGGALLSVWGGPKAKYRIHALLLAVIASSLFGEILLGIGQGVVMWGAGAFLAMFFVPVANSSSHAIWQTKIPPHLQGRVFSARIVIGQIGGALALPLAGILADCVFEPLMLSESRFSLALGGLVGAGAGAGMGLMFILFGTLGALVAAAAFFYRPIRGIDRLLPDHDQVSESAASLDSGPSSDRDPNPDPDPEQAAA
ncbi:MFS transporter [Candidatus Bipolaricaulota bacterium]|nr:MFS transporter [Candidatus Bipolaricaulota bacterium]